MPTEIEQGFINKMVTESWEVYHNGFPDFLCQKNGQSIVVEVKASISDKLKPHQFQMLTLLTKIGLQAFVWTPNSYLPFEEHQKTGNSFLHIDTPQARNTPYQKTKAKLGEQVIEMEDQMLEMWEKGLSMEQLAKAWDFKDRKAVWYHINKAKKRRDAN